MKRILNTFLVAALFSTLSQSSALSASSLQPVTTVDPLLGSPATGGGGSWGPILTPDGRYILFASTANNLAVGSNGLYQPLVAPMVNVFLRDRTSGTTTLVSVNVSGTGGGNGDSIPTALSTNGQFALFESSASDLVTNDANNASDIFERDIVNSKTTLVSVNTNGLSGNGASQSSTMTPDGRYVAFSSSASDLVAGDTNGAANIFVRDTTARTTVIASPGAAGGICDSPVITPDGNYVAFLSTASNVVAGVTDAGDVYVRDMVGLSTIDVSDSARAASGAQFFFNHAISDDGQYVVFESGGAKAGTIFRYDLSSTALDLVSTNGVSAYYESMEFRNLDITSDGRFVAFVGGGAGSSSGVYLWDGQSNATTVITAAANAVCALPSISTNGQYVTYLGSSVDVTSNSTTTTHVHLWNAATGSNAIVDVEPDGQVSFDTFMTRPLMTPDGRFVAFDAIDSNLGGDPQPNYYNVYLTDQTTNTLEIVSQRQAMLPSATARVLGVYPRFSVSSNGQYVAYLCAANRLTGNSSNDYRTVFVADLLHGTNTVASDDINGDTDIFGIIGISSYPVISADGRYVAYSAGLASYIRDLLAGTTTLVLTNFEVGTTPVFDASLSHAVTVSLNFPPGVSEVYYVNLRSNTTSLVARNINANAGAAAITPDGRYVAWGGERVVLWDSLSKSLVYSNNVENIGLASDVTSIAVSPDGNRLAYVTNGVLYGVDRAAKSNVKVATGVSGGSDALQFGGDSRYLVYVTSAPIAAKDTNNANDVYRYDFQAQTNLLVSQNAGGIVGSGPSDWPALSSNGRFIAYRSSASNLFAGEASAYPQIYLYDSQSNTTSLISVSALTGGGGNNRSLAPAFSGDSTTLVFQTWASDLLTNDFSGSGGVDALTVAAYPPALVGAIQISSAGIPIITWPVGTGATYQLQYKNNLTDSSWLPLSGSITVVSNVGTITDSSPIPQQRFYRIQSN